MWAKDEESSGGGTDCSSAESDAYSKEGVSHCQQRVPCCPCICCCCCRCKVPRWSRGPICLLVTYIVFIPVVYVIGHYLVYFGTPPWIDRSKHNIGSCKEFTFPASDGTHLKGIRCDLGNSPNPIPAILLGGNAMDMYSTVVSMPMLLPRSTQSWTVYSMSMPGDQYDGGKPGWTSSGEALQLGHALLQFVGANHSRQSVVLFGWSLGSSWATGLAATAPEEQVRCLILGNPFTSIRAVALQWTRYVVLPYIYLFDSWPTADWVQQVKVPTIVLSSLQDQVIPVWMHNKVYYSSTAEHKTLIEKNTSHMDFRPFRRAAQDAITQWCIS